MDISYQLYSSRNFPPLGETLSMLAGLGYTQVEGFGGLYNSSAQVEELAEGLAASGLAMPTAHFGADQLADPDTVIAMAEKLGIKAIFCPYLDAGDRPSDAAGWTAFGEALGVMGKPLIEAGIAFGWHNHDFEFQAVGGQMPLDLIMAADDSLSLELDVAWVVRGGGDPHAYLTKYASRIRAIHVKDIAPAGECEDEDGWADVGHGTMDWAALMGAAEQTSAEYFVMEHDNPSDHRRFAKRSIATLKSF